MSEILNLKEIIKIIPLLLEYLVPGYIFLTIRNFSFSKDESKDKYIILKSIVLSFILLKTIYPIINAILKHTGFSQDIMINVFIIVVLILSILYIKFDLEKYLVSTLGNGKTTKEDCFDVLLKDVNTEGVLIRAYLEDEKLVYTGSLIYYDDKNSSDKRKFSIAGYTLYNYNGDLIYDHEGNEDNIVLLSMDDIKRIELFR